MYLLHNIGNERHSNYHTREKVLASQGVLTFDGVYQNVYENRDLLRGKNAILFVMGDFIGGNNMFDLGNVPKLERYCTESELRELRDDYGCALGWHTWSHRNLTKLTEEDIRKELTCPEEYKQGGIAYPYGEYDERVIRIAKEMGFSKGYSVFKTDGTDMTIQRPYL